ncbi:MAG: hypothetical protein Q9172_002226 [Xanthocarpia lactea]
MQHTSYLATFSLHCCLGTVTRDDDGSATVKDAEVMLRPWQVVFLAWAMDIEPILRESILADDMGLGKTLSLLSHLILVHDRAAADQQPNSSTDSLALPKPVTGAPSDEATRNDPDPPPFDSSASPDPAGRRQDSKHG